MLPASIRQRLNPVTGAVRAAHPVGGGDVSAAARVEGSRGTFLAKWNAGAGGDSFAAEAEGLAALRATAEASGAGLTVPRPLLAENRTPDAAGLLVLPWIHGGTPSREDWRRFGGALAALHRADPVLPPEAPGGAGATGSAGGPYGWRGDN